MFISGLVFFMAPNPSDALRCAACFRPLSKNASVGSPVVGIRPGDLLQLVGVNMNEDETSGYGTEIFGSGNYKMRQLKQEKTQLGEAYLLHTCSWYEAR